MKLPETNPFQNWRQNHFELKRNYCSNKQGFVGLLIPEIAVGLNIYEVLTILKDMYGKEAISVALNPINTVSSPVSSLQNGDWLKKVNMVGVNIRTLGNFFNLIKYLLTLSETQNSIHILPIWEPGVVASLYGKISWNINPEFYSHELQAAVPDLNTVEKQLKVVTNIIHLMGKTVGLDIIPHTDRFAEITFCNPQFFEWVHRQDHHILSICTENAFKVEDIIWNFLQNKGATNGAVLSFAKEDFFNTDFHKFDEHYKLEILFGHVHEREKRLWRRLELMQEVLHYGFETLPVTMAPPYRGLHLLENDFIYDNRGNKWYTYHFDAPEGMSRVFGPLTRYKFYYTEEEKSQKLDFSRPNIPAWNYISQKYLECQKSYNFDFMRGDMAHVQPRADGVPKSEVPFYDPLLAIKQNIIDNGIKHFGFFAETFIAPPNEMAYGIEEDHLELIRAKSTLGDLQGSVVTSDDFLYKIVKYLDILENRSFAPNFTMITADKDDPRFDMFYQQGNHLRFFIGMFLSNMPSYMSLGFECRNQHLERGKNEEYTKLYVFQITDDKETDKVTHGPFVWGKNYELFKEIEKIKLLADEIYSEIEKEPLNWVKKPTLSQKTMIWEIGAYLFVANLDAHKKLSDLKIDKKYEQIYCSSAANHECQIYKLKNISRAI